MIQDAVWASRLPEHPLETRLAAVIETATSTISAPLMKKIKPRQSCTLRRRLRQQTKLASIQYQASLTRPSTPSNTPALPLRLETAMTWTSQRPGRAVSVRRSSKRRFSGSLIGLDVGAWRTHSSPKGLAASDKNRRLVPHAGLPQMALPLRHICGKCPDAARLHHQRAEETRQQTLGGWWAVSMLRLLPRPTVGARRSLQHSRSYARTLCVRSRSGLQHELAEPGITTVPRRLTASPSRLADIFTTAAVPGRSAAIAAAGRGDAAQAAFDRTL